VICADFCRSEFWDEISFDVLLEFCFKILDMFLTLLKFIDMPSFIDPET